MVAIMVRRSKKKSPQFWQCYRANSTIAPTSSDTVRAEINNDSVDQDASLENSRVSDEVDLASEGTPVEDIALTHTVERSISHIENNAHAESDAVAPVCLEIEAVQPDNTTTTKAQYVLPDQVKQAQDIISSCLEESETAQKDAIDRAISLLYPYKPRDGQRDALHHLILIRPGVPILRNFSEHCRGFKTSSCAIALARFLMRLSVVRAYGFVDFAVTIWCRKSPMDHLCLFLMSLRIISTLS